MTANEFLADLHSRLRSAYLREANKPAGSLFFGLVDLSSKNRRMRILREASVELSVLPSDQVAELREAGLIEEIDQQTRFTLTSKGIWEIEKRQGIVTEDTWLEFAEKKWFNCFSDQKKALNDREKIILLTALAARSFSVESAIDLGDSASFPGWQSAVSQVHDFLQSISRIAPTSNLAFDQQTSLHPLIHFFRYSEYLPGITDGLFVGTNLKYYLKLSKDGDIDPAKLSYLFGTVLGDSVDYRLADQIEAFCRDISYDISPRVFSPDRHIFATPAYDAIVSKALRQLASS